MTDIPLKISIIVPIYNSENTINRCVNSLLHQSYKNTEIILVNDGSSDKSFKIIESFNENYQNIMIINLKNGGPGIARNAGISEATGDYITFVDSDDIISEDAVFNMISCLDIDTDIVIGGFKKIDDNGNLLFSMIPSDNYWTKFKFSSTAFKLYKRTFLIKNMIHFSKFNVYEDLLFNLRAYSKTNKIKYCKRQDYIIYKNPQSITSNFSKRPLKDCKQVLIEIYKDVDMSKYSKATVEFLYYKTIVLNVILQLDGHQVNDINDMYLDDYNWLASISKKKNIRFFWQEYEDKKTNFSVNIFNLFTKLHLSKLLIFLLQKLDKIRVK